MHRKGSDWRRALASHFTFTNDRVMLRHLLIPLLALAPASPAAAQVGTLDPTFDGDGLHTTHFDDDDVAGGVVVRADGGIVVVGYSAEIGIPNTRRARATAYDPTGQVMWAHTFGQSVGGCGSVPSAFQDVLLEPDGDLIVAGYAQYDCAGPQRDFWIHRLSPEGSSQGLFQRPVFNGQFEAVMGLARQSDGRIVAAGVAGSINTLSSYDVAVARFEPDGTLDDTFGDEGEFILDVSGDHDTALDVAVQPDGLIAAVGYRTIGAQRDALIFRLTADGALDSTFGAGGIVTSDFAGFNDFFGGVAVQPDGKLIVAGSRTEADGVSTTFIVHRYLSDGTLDPSFGVGGVTAVDFTGLSAGAADLILLANGRIVVAGTTQTGAGGLDSRDFAIARLMPDGSFDPDFAGDGRQIANVTGGADIGQALAMQPDGDFVVAGFAEFDHEGELHRDWALARFLGEAPTGVEGPAGDSAGDRLQPPSPNPVRARALVSYEIAAAGPARLVVLDALGREVAAVVDGGLPVGRHEAAIDIRALHDGVYVLRLTTARGTEARRFTVAR